MILGLGPVLKIVREVRPAPGRTFITGLLGFDDACKHFEDNSYPNVELSAAYAKIEVFSTGSSSSSIQVANCPITQLGGYR